MRARFTFLSGARSGQVEVFAKAYIGLGRHPLSDVRCDADRDLDVSSRHAAIVRKNDTFHIQDLGSRNGTLLNGRPIEGEVVLSDGDVIGLGRSGPTVEFRTIASADESDVSGAEALARRVSASRDPIAAVRVPPRASTAARIAVEVARQTRLLRTRTKAVLGALLVGLLALGGFEWQAARARGATLARLTARADSLSSRAQALEVRFAGELESLRRALDDSRRATERLRRELDATGGDAGTVARLRAAVEAAEVRQRDLISAAAVDYRAIARRNQDAVAIVLVEFSDRERLSGTAFAVDSQGVLVTNRHLLVGEDGARHPRRVGVMFAGSRQNFAAEVLGVDSIADLAALRVKIAGGVPRTGGLSRGLERGDPVAIIGYPLGFDLPMGPAAPTPVAEPTLTVGTVSKVLSDVIQLDAYGAPGSSGSPVFDGEARIAAVLFGGERESQGRIIYAVPAQVVARFLRSLGVEVGR